MSNPQPPPAPHAATPSSLTIHQANGPPLPSQSHIQAREWKSDDSTTTSRTASIFSDSSDLKNSADGRLEQDISSDEDEEGQKPSDTKVDPPLVETAPYHVFTPAKKKVVVYIVSFAALFSPLSSNIYFPALGDIAKDYNVSMSLISLTVTVYMIVQGIAPSFWGPLSDTKGRRITFIGTFVVYLISNIGLAFSNNLKVLFVFRAIQAAGSAATISVGAGVIGDITTSRERGGFIGVFAGIRNFGQSVGPVFGGVISQYLGYHAIFWFLFGLGALTLFTIILLVPETLRSIAGNGTIPLTSIHRPLIYTKPTDPPQEQSRPAPKKVTISSIFAPLKFLFEKDVFITLFFGSVVYTVWSMVTSSTTAVFQDRFNLNTLEVGLAFIPNGVGCAVGSYSTGYIMDRDYKIFETRYRKDKGLPPDTVLNKKELVDFPIEQSRMRNVWWMVVLFVTCTAFYGYSLEMDILAIPLVLQFLIAASYCGVFALNSALVIDLYPGASASATAVNNLARCSLGSIGVAVVQYIIDGVGAGVTFAIFAGITAACSPLLVLEWFYGQKFRDERRERLRREEEAKREAQAEKARGAS